MVPTDVILGRSTEWWAGVSVSVVTRRILAKDGALWVLGAGILAIKARWLESQSD